MKATASVIGFAILALACSSTAQEFHPDIPRVWDNSAVKNLELPLAQRDRSPRYITAEEYYKLKVRPIYRPYPVMCRVRSRQGISNG